MTRRNALGLLAGSPATMTSASTPDSAFSSALDAAASIANRRISSVDLTTQVFERIDRYQPKLNAFVYLMRDEAMAAARLSDARVAKKEKLPPLNGVPVVVKESFAIEGRPCTWGIPALKNTRAPRNSTAVQRLIDAGAVVLGATNVPLNLSDGQSYNDIYGTTNNPWDVSRTPGGSSGGTAAALAAGLGFLGLGSDIGGSIRSPAHCCGIYGHKPTLDVVSELGHAPGGGGLPGFSTNLAAAGPLARTAEDLEAAMRILGGPDSPHSIAYTWRMPAPRHRSIGDFRIGYILEDPAMHVSSEVKPLLEAAVRALEKAGAKLKPGWPQGFAFADFLSIYFQMLSAFIYGSTPPSERDRYRAEFGSDRNDPFAQGLTLSFPEWHDRNVRRLVFRAAWQQYFKDVDAFVLPALPVPAFPHDHTPQAKRVLHTPEGPLPYLPGLLTYMSLGILTGCPATVAPAGKTKTGLPVGVQIMGPFLEDATPIQLAALLSREIGGVTPPPGY